MAKHVRYECPKSCDIWLCPICEGGLFSCTVCGASEGELTTDCPGEIVPRDRRELVLDGLMDFKDGKWSKKR